METQSIQSETWLIVSGPIVLSGANSIIMMILFIVHVSLYPRSATLSIITQFIVHDPFYRTFRKFLKAFLWEDKRKVEESDTNLGISGIFELFEVKL